jgi:AraC-like DNA-binding protein
VRNIIVATPGVFPNIEDVAESLETSVRSLRRKLADEDSGYQKLLNEIRIEMAKNYLQTNMPVERIAEHLGYSEGANFSHAFKRYSQQTPSQYREAMDK